MNFNYYCKRCASQVEKVFDNTDALAFKCECTDSLLSHKSVIAGYTRDSRINQLKAMHQLMLEANDESIYMSWIYTMPDCPSEDDFESIAVDDESYNECFDKFVRLIGKPGNRY